MPPRHVDAIDQDGAVLSGCVRQQAEGCGDEYALAAAKYAYDAERLTLRHLERNAIDRFENTLARQRNVDQ